MSPEIQKSARVLVTEYVQLQERVNQNVNASVSDTESVNVTQSE